MWADAGAVKLARPLVMARVRVWPSTSTSTGRGKGRPFPVFHSRVTRSPSRVMTRSGRAA
ncbi:hypothetical protein D3C72_2152310 [compost metagenome]